MKTTIDESIEFIKNLLLNEDELEKIDDVVIRLEKLKELANETFAYGQGGGDYQEGNKNGYQSLQSKLKELL